MTTPIRPSLAQMLNPQATTPRPPSAQAPAQPGSFSSALNAQRAFFQQATQPKIAPATYTAADIAQATRATGAPAAGRAPTVDYTQPLKRPGSYLNIVI